MFKQEGKKKKSRQSSKSGDRLSVSNSNNQEKNGPIDQTLSMRLLLAMNAGFWNTASKIILLVRIGYSAAQKIVVFGVMRFVEKREVFLTTESFFVQNAQKKCHRLPNSLVYSYSVT